MVKWHTFVGASSKRGPESMSLVFKYESIAELWPHILFGYFTNIFDWLFLLSLVPPCGEMTPLGGTKVYPVVLSLYAMVGVDTAERCCNMGSLPVWRLGHWFRLAITDESFQKSKIPMITILNFLRNSIMVENTRLTSRGLLNSAYSKESNGT